MPVDGAVRARREAVVRMAALFLFEGDELACERIYFDTATIASQLFAEPE